jgi:hypothetical protein
MRGQINSKSDTCTESMEVYAAGINAKAGAHYPGRSVNLFQPLGLSTSRGVEKDCQKSAEAIVGKQSPVGVTDHAEGPNVKVRQEVLNFDDEGDADK